MITSWRQRILAPLSRCTRGVRMRRLVNTTIVPLWLRRIDLVLGIPVIGVDHWTNTSTVTIRLTPSVSTSQRTTNVDAAFMEVFHTLTPFNNRETLEGRSCPKNCSLRRFECHFEGFCQLRQHVRRCARFDRIPLME